MHGHKQRRDGEKLVVTDAVAARLLGVADEGRLLIPPNAFGSNHQHQNAKDEDDREPDSPNSSRMPVYAADHGIKGSPVHLRLQVCQGTNMKTEITKIGNLRIQNYLKINKLFIYQIRL
uniref:Uncharacterized protein n=1 Tax=Oryzias latipes TaxID=8090 RepID=A0A3P9KHL5_ORYLA